MTDNAQTDLLRFIASQIYMQNLMSAARDMFSKPYSSLSPVETQAVEQWVWASAGGIREYLKPESLADPETTKQPVGFAAHPAKRGDGQT